MLFLRWVVIVHFVDIGGMADHHLFKLLFIILFTGCFSTIIFFYVWNVVCSFWNLIVTEYITRECTAQKNITWRAWGYQRGSLNPYIEEEQTTQWPKEKGQKDKKRSTKHTYKTEDRATRTPLKTGYELGCSERVSSSCCTSNTRRVNIVTNPVISHEWGKDREVFMTNGTYPWSFMIQIFHSICLIFSNC
jgi:hypothetical protein